MKILEFGNSVGPTLMLIHGFQCPYQMWEKYITHFEKDYRILLPVLPGHDPDCIEKMTSFDDCALQVESFLQDRSILKIDFIYAISVGGLLAGSLLSRNRIGIGKVIFESSPLLGFGRLTASILKKQYLMITRQARLKQKEVLEDAARNVVTADNLDYFLEVIYKMPDEIIVRYLQLIQRYRLPKQLFQTGTRIIYLYGKGWVESYFKKTARFIEKYYKGAIALRLDVKGHCHDALLNPEKKIRELDLIIK